MTKRRIESVLILGAFLWGATEARAEGVAIDHKGVGCIVANKYAKFDACFDPASNLAKGRVYFRAEGGPFWYFVDMKPEATCFSGVIPKVKKSTPKINYYVQGVDKSFAESRTAEFDPIVVGSAEECKKKVAGALPSANVTVGAAAGAPAVPAGFAAAGASSALVTAGVIGAAAATGGVIAATHKSSSNPTSPPVTPPASTPQTMPSPTPPPATLGAGVLSASFSVSPNPPTGNAPLDVTFNMCASSDSQNHPLTFTYAFGDGASSGGSFCKADHVYKFTASQKVIDLTTSAAKICVSNGSQTACHTFKVNPLCGDTAPPRVQIIAPPAFSSQNTPFDVTASASDDGRVLEVDFFYQEAFCGYTGCPRVHFGKALNPPYVAQFSVPTACSQFFLQAQATDACGNNAASQPVKVFVSNPTGCSAGVIDLRQLNWATELQSKGASGQVILNGDSVSYASTGRSYAGGKVRSGDNRIEAKLSAGGEAGTWRFEFLGTESFVPGSLRIVAGEVAQVTANAIVFRIKGTPGERVVLSFKAR